MTEFNARPLPLVENVGIRGLDENTCNWIQAEAGPDVRLIQNNATSAPIVFYGENYAADLHADIMASGGDEINAALCLQQPCQDSYLALLHMHVHNVIYQNSIFAADALKLAMRSRASLKATRLERDALVGVLPDVDPIEVTRRELYTMDDVRIIPEMKAFLSGYKFTAAVIDNASLAIKEAVTNAVFHGFREKGTHLRKYSPDHFERLQEGDEICVTMTAMADWVGIKIMDNGGSLGPLSLANSLDRHRTERGLYDHRGRGFHLMRHLAHRVVVVIDRGRSTSVELYFLHDTDGAFQRHFELVEI